MIKSLFVVLLSTFIIFSIAVDIQADNIQSKLSKKMSGRAREAIRSQLIPRHPPPYLVKKAPGHYTTVDWKAVIDSTWGNGPSQSVKSARYETFWNTIDDKFACFHNLDIDWDSVGNRYSSEINDSSVSRGRFAAILNHSARLLHEGHTRTSDSIVYYTELAPGVPLMSVGSIGIDTHFGAGLTPLPDSSLLVYNAVENHPLGLVPGDIVLGYDRIPWKELYRELLEAELPMYGMWWGSSESAYTYAFLSSAGQNWHLFDTIDVVKYDTGDTLHLATSVLAGQYFYHLATDQIKLPGIPKPFPDFDIMTTRGFIEGTKIGYIYCYGWISQSSWEDWVDAIEAFVNDSETTGLIIDFRTNWGGSPSFANDGLKLLFSSTVDTIGIDMRADPDNHFNMIPSTIVPSDWFVIEGDSGSYFNKPIAVLIGPGCASMGDFAALILSLHPKTKLFGKPSASMFNGPETYTAESDFYFKYSRSETYLLGSPGQYLTRREFPNPVDFPWVDFEEVWLTRDGVAQGKDDVVEAAMAWINSAVDTPDDPEYNLPNNFILNQNYPNPFNQETVISYNLPNRTDIKINVYNITGQYVKTLVDENKSSGTYFVEWDGTDTQGETVASGVYIYKLTAGEVIQTKKMVLLK